MRVLRSLTEGYRGTKKPKEGKLLEGTDGGTPYVGTI